MTCSAMIRLSLVVVAAMIASAIWAGLRLPPDAQLPLHWNADGVVDRQGGKWLALLLPAAISAVTTALFAALPAIEPMRANLERSAGLYRVAWVTMILLFLVVHLMVLDAALGWHVVGPHWLLAAIGLLFILLGNQLGKSRPMYLVGIRTPWTLADPDVWIATHRFAGRVMVLGGMIWLLLVLFGRAGDPRIFLGTVALVTGLPILYSYLAWRRAGHPARH